MSEISRKREEDAGRQEGKASTENRTAQITVGEPGANGSADRPGRERQSRQNLKGRDVPTRKDKRSGTWKARDSQGNVYQR